MPIVNTGTALTLTIPITNLDTEEPADPTSLLVEWGRDPDHYDTAQSTSWTYPTAAEIVRVSQGLYRVKISTTGLAVGKVTGCCLKVMADFGNGWQPAKVVRFSVRGLPPFTS